MKISLGPLRRFLDFLAKMGLSIRDDPPRVIDLALREWGPIADNFALSAAKLPSDDPDAVPALSVVLRNFGSEPASLRIPPWLVFYKIQVFDSDHTPVPLTPYGRELLKPERNSALQWVTLQPGAATETQIPVGAVFAMIPRRNYTLKVSCTQPDTGRTLDAKALII